MSSAANDDSSGLPIFTIPTFDKTDAVDFIIEKLEDVNTKNICFTVQFASTDAQFLNLCEVWEDFKERMVLDTKWLNREPKLSFVSPESLVIKWDSEMHNAISYAIWSMLVMAVSKADTHFMVSQKFEVERKIEYRNVHKPYELYSPGGAIDLDKNPLVWCEIADRETYKHVLDKIMHMSSLFPEISTFVIFCVYSNNNTPITDSDSDFVIDIQAFVRLTNLDQLGGDGSISTLHAKSNSRFFPYPDPELRQLDQKFDLKLAARRVFEFQGEGPISRLLGDVNFVPTRIVSKDFYGRDFDGELKLDLLSIVSKIQYRRANLIHKQIFDQPKAKKRRLFKELADDVVQPEGSDVLASRCSYDPVKENLA